MRAYSEVRSVVSRLFRDEVFKHVLTAAPSLGHKGSPLHRPWLRVKTLEQLHTFMLQNASHMALIAAMHRGFCTFMKKYNIAKPFLGAAAACDWLTDKRHKASHSYFVDVVADCDIGCDAALSAAVADTMQLLEKLLEGTVEVTRDQASTAEFAAKMKEAAPLQTAYLRYVAHPQHRSVLKAALLDKPHKPWHRKKGMPAKCKVASMGSIRAQESDEAYLDSAAGLPT